MSKGTFWIVGVVVFISRVFVSTKEMMMMATPTMQHAPATTTPAAVEVRGIVFFFLFFKFFFFFIVVYVVVFRDWIFGYERRWLSLSMMISFRLDAKRAWHDLTFLFLSLSLSGIDDTAEIFVQTRVLVPRDRLPSGGEENGVPEGQMFCVESGKQIRARRQHERWRTREYWFLALEDARECETRRDFMRRRGRNG